MLRSGWLRTAVPLLATALLAPGLGAGAFPDRTDAGEWAGTWFYTSREQNIAFWFRDNAGRPQLKIRILNNDRTEGFVTNWDTESDYTHAGRRGHFRLTYTQRDQDTIRGHWHWQYGAEGERVRIDRGDITIYRAHQGRQLVVRFENSERVHRQPDGTEGTIPTTQSWTFHKASRRLAHWGELPF